MPKGHGNRVVKPPSAKQQAHAQRHTNAHSQRIVILPSDAGLPTCSWWTIYKSRAEFDQAVAREAERMKLSALGRTRYMGE